MNALAFDQAAVHHQGRPRHPDIARKASAGLYVCERERLPHTTMGPERLVTGREMLCEYPPHILLANYKTLDFLMIRSADAHLWRHNQPGSLRYMVVDKLQRFDGPQGPDFTCFIRRLKDRLRVLRQANAVSTTNQAPRQGLICVGVSAVVGG